MLFQSRIKSKDCHKNIETNKIKFDVMLSLMLLELCSLKKDFINKYKEN